ncbi:hypothetical protein ATANTOWER_011099 [Ataeniobius toweri]|uniref:Uncharacterized protein n=1 Tax=Ataeniobius toweri TaxID=208326 RepID=A0ABU7BFJ2_9TELE|nr:hypothetical protein [Ataeniobius toweri]
MGTPPQMSFIPEKPTKQHPHSASSTHSPAPSTPASSHPHHTARPQGKGPVQRYPTYRRNRADTIEHQAHNGTLDPTPRRDKLTRQEVPGQQQALGAGVPHRNHTDTPHHCHCNHSPGGYIIQLCSTTAAQQIQMPVTPLPRRGHPPTIHPPARHTSPHQADLPAPPPKRSHISINTAKPRPPHWSTATRTPTSAQIPTRKPAPSPGLRGCVKRPPSLPPPTQMWC